MLDALDASLQWHQCQDKPSLQRSVAVVLERLLPAKTRVERHEVNASETSPGRLPPGRRGSLVAFPDRSRCEIRSIAQSGAALSVSVAQREGGFSRAERELLREAAAHIATAHQQLDRMEHLRALVEDWNVAQTRPGSGIALYALTPAEKRIAEKVGQGLSNGEIARQRGISRRTVEKHLESVYAKLGLENRYQLAREMADATPRIESG